MPTQATGTPPGTCAVASSASKPFSGPTANGTPITGKSVSEAANPGSAADNPAPAMMTRNPRSLAPDTSFVVCSGCRWADDTWNSYETPALVRISKAGSMRGLSLSEPTRTRTSATSGRLVDHAVVLTSLPCGVARVRDEAAHFGKGHPPGRARGGHDVFFHHEGAEVIGPEPEGHLADLRTHGDPRRLDVRDVVQHDTRDCLGPEVGDRVGLLEVLELRVLRLQRPADEGGKPSGARLDLADAEQVLDPVGQRLAEPIHHGHGRLEPEAMRGLHHLEPAVGAGFLLRDAIADLLDEDFTAPTRDRIEACRRELADHLFDRHPEASREEIDLGGREPVDVDRVVPLDVAHQVEVPLERDVGVVPALDEDLHPADGFELVDLAADLLERQHVSLGVLRPTVERAELAVRDADIRVVDVPVDDVRDDVLRVEAPARLIRQAAQLEQ